MSSLDDLGSEEYDRLMARAQELRGTFDVLLGSSLPPAQARALLSLQQSFQGHLFAAGRAVGLASCADAAHESFTAQAGLACSVERGSVLLHLGVL
jgi:hypothetical protein